MRCKNELYCKDIKCRDQNMVVYDNQCAYVRQPNVQNKEFYCDHGLIHNVASNTCLSAYRGIRHCDDGYDLDLNKGKCFKRHVEHTSLMCPNGYAESGYNTCIGYNKVNISNNRQSEQFVDQQQTKSMKHGSCNSNELMYEGRCTPYSQPSRKCMAGFMKIENNTCLRRIAYDESTIATSKRQLKSVSYENKNKIRGKNAQIEYERQRDFKGTKRQSKIGRQILDQDTHMLNSKIFYTDNLHHETCFSTCAPERQYYGKKYILTHEETKTFGSYVTMPKCPSQTIGTVEGECLQVTEPLRKCPLNYQSNKNQCVYTYLSKATLSCPKPFVLVNGICLRNKRKPLHALCHTGIRKGDWCVTEQKERIEYICPEGYALETSKHGQHQKVNYEKDKSLTTHPKCSKTLNYDCSKEVEELKCESVPVCSVDPLPFGCMEKLSQSSKTIVSESMKSHYHGHSKTHQKIKTHYQKVPQICKTIVRTIESQCRKKLTADATPMCNPNSILKSDVCMKVTYSSPYAFCQHNADCGNVEHITPIYSCPSGQKSFLVETMCVERNTTSISFTCPDGFTYDHHWRLCVEETHVSVRKGTGAGGDHIAENYIKSGSPGAYNSPGKSLTDEFDINARKQAVLEGMGFALSSTQHLKPSYNSTGSHGVTSHSNKDLNTALDFHESIVSHPALSTCQDELKLVKINGIDFCISEPNNDSHETKKAGSSFKINDQYDDTKDQVDNIRLGVGQTTINNVDPSANERQNVRRHIPKTELPPDKQFLDSDSLSKKDFNIHTSTTYGTHEHSFKINSNESLVTREISLQRLCLSGYVMNEQGNCEKKMYRDISIRCKNAENLEYNGVCIHETPSKAFTTYKCDEGFKIDGDNNCVKIMPEGTNLFESNQEDCQLYTCENYDVTRDLEEVIAKLDDSSKNKGATSAIHPSKTRICPSGYSLIAVERSTDSYVCEQMVYDRPKKTCRSGDELVGNVCMSFRWKHATE